MEAQHEYINHLQSAYRWYNLIKGKKHKTPTEISYIISIEEAQKTAILHNYQLQIHHNEK